MYGAGDGLSGILPDPGPAADSVPPVGAGNGGVTGPWLVIPVPARRTADGTAWYHRTWSVSWAPLLVALLLLVTLATTTGSVARRTDAPVTSPAMGPAEVQAGP
jgi:hypothetical protein